MGNASADAYDALVLAGGRGHRLGGTDKPSLVVDGHTLLERVAAAVTDAVRLIVVGPVRERVPDSAVTVTEDPPGGGPVAAIAAGLPHVRSITVAVLAADLPFLTAEAITGLRTALAAAPDAAAVLPVDETGRDQPLCALWRTPALASALDAAGDVRGTALHRLVGAAAPRVLRITPPAGRCPSPWFDCDTPADLARARHWARGGGR